MKLAKYLADYIETEIDRGACCADEETIQNGLEAFTSTEYVTIVIRDVNGISLKEIIE